MTFLYFINKFGTKIINIVIESFEDLRNSLRVVVILMMIFDYFIY